MRRIAKLFNYVQGRHGLELQFPESETVLFAGVEGWFHNIGLDAHTASQPLFDEAAVGVERDGSILSGLRTISAYSG